MPKKCLRDYAIASVAAGMFIQAAAFQWAERREFPQSEAPDGGGALAPKF